MEEELQNCFDEQLSRFLFTVSISILIFINKLLTMDSVHISDAWWLMIYPMVVPYLEKLPTSWTTPWLP